MNRIMTILLAMLVSATAAFAGGGTGEEGSSSSASGGTIATAPSGIYNESPMLASRVAAGELPPVDERLPVDPMVIEPYESVGRYGGTIRIAEQNFTNGVWLGQRNGSEQLVKWDAADPTNVIPSIASSWETSADGRTFTFHLREGLKWSDGEPMTAQDVSFWWNDYETYTELKRNPTSVWTAGGPPEVVAVDDTTVRFTFPLPHGLFMAMTAFRGNEMVSHPMHYMSQIHPEYTPLDEVQAKAAERGFENWQDLYAAELLNSAPDRPRMSPWVIVEQDPSIMLWERNPYYFKVDTANNQLPYIDRMESHFITDKEVIALRLQSGELDFDAQRMTIADFPVLSQADNLDVFTWQLPSTSVVHLNYNTENEVLAEVFSDKRFRIALAIGVDRSDIIENQFLGLGTPHNILPDDPYGIPELADDYTQYDPEEANRLLDEMGLDQRDSQGFRLGPDGNTFTFVVGVIPGIGSREPAVFEIIAEYWREQLGIDVRMNLEQSGIWRNRQIQNEQDAIFYGAAGYQWVLSPNGVIPVSNFGWTAPLWGRYYNSNGSEGVEPPPNVRRLQTLYDELKATADPAGQAEIGEQLIRLVHENYLSIGFIQSRAVVAMSNQLRNVAGDEAIMDWRLKAPNYLEPSQWYYAE